MTHDSSQQQLPQLHRPLSVARKLAIGVFVLALVLAAVCLFGFFSVKRELDTKLAAMKAAGLPTTSAQINNYYSVPDGVDDTTIKWTAATKAARTISAAIEAGTKEDADAVIDPLPGTPWEGLADRKLVMDKSGAQLQAIYAAASAGGQVRFPVDYSPGFQTMLPYLTDIRNVVDMLSLHAFVRAHEGGQSDQVHRDVVSILAAGEVLQGEVTLVGLLIQLAHVHRGLECLEKLMPFCEWSDDQLSELQAKLVSVDPRNGIQRSIIGERAICIDAANEAVVWVVRDDNRLRLVEYTDELLVALDESWLKAIETAEDIERRFRALMSKPIQRYRYYGVAQLMPAHRKVIEAAARADAARRVAFLGLGMQRHFLRHGKFPTSIEAIDADLISDNGGIPMTTDPFDGQPMRFMNTTVAGEPQSLLICSISENRTDDKGERDEMKGGGRSPDIVFEVKIPVKIEAE